MSGKTVIIDANPSKGLLISMCMRDNHAFCINLPGYSLTEAEREAEIEHMRMLHQAVIGIGEKLENGKVKIPTRIPQEYRLILMEIFNGCEITLEQVYEEISGEGFYSVKKEIPYQSMLNKQEIK
jgi:hypothetical protein